MLITEFLMPMTVSLKDQYCFQHLAQDLFRTTRKPRLGQTLEALHQAVIHPSLSILLPMETITSFCTEAPQVAPPWILLHPLLFHFSISLFLRIKTFNSPEGFGAKNGRWYPATSPALIFQIH